MISCVSTCTSWRQAVRASVSSSDSMGASAASRQAWPCTVGSTRPARRAPGRARWAGDDAATGLRVEQRQQRRHIDHGPGAARHPRRRSVPAGHCRPRGATGQRGVFERSVQVRRGGVAAQGQRRGLMGEPGQCSPTPDGSDESNSAKATSTQRRKSSQAPAPPAQAASTPSSGHPQPVRGHASQAGGEEPRGSGPAAWRPG